MSNPNKQLRGGFMRLRGILAGPLLMAAIVAGVFLSGGALALAQQQRGHGFDLANLDKSCKPCDDFNRFASGGWAKTHPIPPEYPVWGSFATLTDENQKKIGGFGSRRRKKK